MPATHDVTLGGVGYMLKPGSYQRYQDGATEGRIGRVRLADFYGGAGRAFQAERDRVLRGRGAWPAFDSQGLTAGPQRRDVVEVTSPLPAPQARRWVFTFGGATYVVQASHLYRVTASGGLYAGLISVQALAAPVSGVTQLGSALYFGHGAVARLTKYDLASGVYTNPLSATAPYVDHIEIEGNQLIAVMPTNPSAVQQVAPSGALVTLYPVDAPVRRLALVDGHCWVFTDRSVQRFTAAGSAPTPETSYPSLAYDDDLAWVVAHFGRIYSWIGHEVVFYDTVDDVFRSTGLRGRGTRGASTVGNWLVVSIERELDGMTELWAWDGRGWWLVDEQVDGTTAWGWPVRISGASRDADLLAGRGDTSGQLSVWQFAPRAGLPGLRESVTIETPLWDAGARDLDKVWRRVGAELAWPDGRAGTPPVTVTLAYSADGGASWATVATQAVGGAAARTFTVTGTLPAVRSRWLQLRMTMNGITTWAPVLAGLWAEHELLDASVRRRRWRFTVLCRDHVVRRDGSVDAAGARATASGLWDAWQAGALLAFSDVDSDSTGQTSMVRIAGIRETMGKTFEGEIADSEVELTLVEV